jgi:hypothetical protein
VDRSGSQRVLRSATSTLELPCGEEDVFPAETSA